MTTAENAERSAERAEKMAEKTLGASGPRGGQQAQRKKQCCSQGRTKAENAENRAAEEERYIARDTKREMKTEAKEEIALKDASDAADKVSEYHSETTRDEDEATLAKGVEEKALKDVAREQVCAFVAHSKPEMC